jgi:hypothetical protein
VADDSRPRRRIGRILSLGFPMPGVRVDNYSFISAPSFFDYDAMVVNVAAITKLLAGVLDGSVDATTFADRPVRGAADETGALALADVIVRRRNETRQMFANGGVIVLLGATPQEHRAGDGNISDLDWLDDAPILTAAEGTEIEILDYGHPMSQFLSEQQANISYRARIDGEVTKIARSRGGAIVGAEMARAGGHVVVLPALKSLPGGEGRYAMSEALQSGIRRMIGVMGEGREPPWAASFAEKLPAELADTDRSRWLRLLWQEGQLGLEDVVLDALKLVGFDVYATNPDALEARAQGTTLLLEIDGSSEAVGLAAHYRLRQRIERAVQRGGAVPRGLIVINGYRYEPPAERPLQATPALTKLAEMMGYGLAPATGLFDAVAARLSGDEAAVATYRERLLAGRGLID